MGTSLGVSASYAWSSINTIEAAVAMEMKGRTEHPHLGRLFMGSPQLLEVMSCWFWLVWVEESVLGLKMTRTWRKNTWLVLDWLGTDKVI
ncbi:MAG: hypothetical protein IPJ71_19110 [Bdellovibrionales bacterium]|nr:hypothetical protein [Bdellovibrionales bacterium]